MAGQYRFKDQSGNVVAQISASSAGAISFSGSAVDFSNASTITLGEVQLAGTASNALLLDGFDSTAFVFTSSFNTISQSISSQLTTLQTTSGSNIGRLNNLESKSASVDISISNINSFTASNTNTSLNSLTASYATTGSNTFFGTQTFSGSVYIANDLIVQGSSSIQYISASSVSIGTNIVQLNTANPSIRFAGLTITDSGSIGGSGSFLYDSLQDEFVFVHRGNGSNITSSHFVLGPETYDSLGNETYLTCNVITKGTGKEHLVDSTIFDNGTTVCVNSNLIGTGTACFGGQICAPTVVASTCLAVRAGNATLVANNIAGAASNNHFAIQRNDAQYASIGLNGSDNFTVFGTSTSCPRLTIDGSGIASFTSQICTVAIVTGDLRYTGTGYITYDTSASGTSCLIIRQNATEKMRISEGGYVAVTGNEALSCVPYLQGMSFGWNRTNGQGESMINWTNAGGGTACDLTFNFRDSSTLYERLRLTSTGIACFACSVIANGDFNIRNTSFSTTGTLNKITWTNLYPSTYNVADIGVQLDGNYYNGAIIFRTADADNANVLVERMRMESRGVTCFRNTVCAGAGMVANTLTISCNSGDDRAMYMSLNCSYNYNSGAANTIARSVNSLKFLWYNNCWEIGATRGDDTAIQSLVFAKNGNTYLAMTCHGIANFACQVCAPLFKGGSFLTATCTFAATSAGTNYDITGPGSGRWLASVGTNAVYHWNGVLALTFFDSADFGVNILTCGSYATAASVSIVNSGSSLRFCFSQNVGTVTVNYLSL